MQSEYFITSDGNAPPRGNRLAPAAHDIWIAKLLAESAAIRQSFELKCSEGDAERLLCDPLQSIVHHRVPWHKAPAESIHNFRASIGLPSGPELPVTRSDICVSDDDSACSVDSDDIEGIDELFPFRQREYFSYSNMSFANQEKMHWSLAEDRLLLQLDASYQALTEGYLHMQARFPQLFPKNVDEWVAMRQHGERIKRDVGDLSRDAIDLADPEILKNQKSLRASIMDSLPRAAEHLQSDAVFRLRLQELKLSQDRQSLLLSLPEDPTIFLPPPPPENEPKALIPPPKAREPTLAERQDSIRAALFTGQADSKEAKHFMEGHTNNAFITCISDGVTAKVPCHQQTITKNAPFFEKQCEFGGSDLKVDNSDPFWRGSMGGAFGEHTVKRFVALCQNPGLLPKVHALQHERDAMQSSFESVYIDFLSKTEQLQADSVKQLKEDKEAKTSMTLHLFKDMLAEDINTLTRIYRQHVSRELRQIEQRYEAQAAEVTSHYEEELGYLKLAKAHFRPAELKAIEERAQVVESVLQRDILNTKDIPNLLKMTEAVLSSSVKSQVLQVMADQMSRIGHSSIVDIFSNAFVSPSTASEFLSFLPDSAFLDLFKYVQKEESQRIELLTPSVKSPLDSSLSNSSFFRPLPTPSNTKKSPMFVSVTEEWKRRADSKRQQLKSMPVADVSRLHQEVSAFRNGKHIRTQFVDWEELLVEALAKVPKEGFDRLLTLSESNGAKGTLSGAAAGSYDVALCSAGLPVVVSSIPNLRVGVSSSVVYFEVTITSAYQSDIYPYGVQIGLEPVKGCLSRAQHEAFEASLQKSAALALNKKRVNQKAGDEGKATVAAADLSERKGYATGPSPPGIFCTNVSSDASNPIPTFGCGWSSDGLLYIDGTSYCVQEGYGEGDVVGISLDLLSGAVSWFKNNSAITLTNFSTSRPIQAILPPIVAYSPSISLISTATRNGVPSDLAMEGIIHSVLTKKSQKTLAPPAKSSALSQLEVLTARIQLSDPFKCAVARDQRRHFVGFAQVVEM